MPVTAAASSSLTLATACLTPLPPHSCPPSRSSTASNSPVDAPDGTAARPAAPTSAARRPPPSGCRGCPDLPLAVHSLDLAQAFSTCSNWSAARLRASSGSSPLYRASCTAARKALRSVARRPLTAPPRALRASGSSWRRGSRKRPWDVAEDLAAALVLALDLFQLRMTSPADTAATSPNTCGWRRSASRGSGRPPRRATPPALLEQQGQEENLEEDVAKLVEQLGVVAHGRRPPAHMPPRPCAGRSSARPARGPRGTHAQPARDLVELPDGLQQPAGWSVHYCWGVCWLPPWVPPEPEPVSVFSFGALLHSGIRKSSAQSVCLVVLAEALDPLVEAVCRALRAKQVADRLLGPRASAVTPG